MNNDGWQRARCCVLIRLARIMIFCAGLCFPTRIYVFQCVSLFFASKAGCRAKSTSRTQHSAKPARSRINHPHANKLGSRTEWNYISKLFPSWFTESVFLAVFLSGCQERGRWHWCQGPRRRGFHGPGHGAWCPATSVDRRCSQGHRSRHPKCLAPGPMWARCSMAAAAGVEPCWAPFLSFFWVW